MHVLHSLRTCLMHMPYPGMHALCNGIVMHSFCTCLTHLPYAYALCTCPYACSYAHRMRPLPTPQRPQHLGDVHALERLRQGVGGRRGPARATQPHDHLRVGLAVDATSVILLTPPSLPLVGVSTGMKRGFFD